MTLIDDCRRVAAAPNEHSIQDVLALIVRLAEALDQKPEISGPTVTAVETEWKKNGRRKR